MKAFSYDALPGRIVFGIGAVARVPDELEAVGAKRVLLICDAAATTAAEAIGDALGARCAGYFSEVRQHVPEDLACEAFAAAAAARADTVLTVGGGSATGLGKAVVRDADLVLASVPTTYAGSEMTPIYGITGEHKVTGRDLRVLPRLVIYDPELTVGLPSAISAATGFNALAHCIEALYTPKANPVTSLMALEGIRALARALPAVVGEPEGLDGRSDALYGAYLAGASLAVAGTALHHKLCHVLGGTFGLVHGDLNAVLLPHVVAFNASAVPGVFTAVAAALGAPADPSAAAPALADLRRALGAPTSLASIGMPAYGLDEAAERTVAETASANPRPVDVPSLRKLLAAAYEGLDP